MCTHPEPPPISWTFLLPLLTRTFFDHYISGKCCIITIPCPSSVRSSSPASEASAGLPLCKLGPCLHESPNTNHAWLILEEWIRLLLVKEILHDSIPYHFKCQAKIISCITWHVMTVSFSMKELLVCHYTASLLQNNFYRTVNFSCRFFE